MAIRGPYRRRNQRNRTLGKGTLQNYSYQGLHEDGSDGQLYHRFELVIDNMLYLMDSLTEKLLIEADDILCFRFNEHFGIRTIEPSSLGIVIDPNALHHCRQLLHQPGNAPLHAREETAVGCFAE